MQEKIYEIYALCTLSSLLSEEQTDYRYVGVTRVGRHRRLRAHLSNALRGARDRKAQWIRETISCGENIVCVLLSRVETPEQALYLEQGFIADLCECYDLLNSTVGGDGVTGTLSSQGRKRVSDNSRSARLSEIASMGTLGMHSHEARLKTAQKLRGRRHTDLAWANMSAGVRKRYENPSQRAKTASVLSAIRVSCPVCGLTTMPGPLGFHRKSKGH